MPVGITELVSKIGDDKIKFHLLDECAINLDYERKKGTRITFGTDQALLPNGTKDMGFVIWLPRDLVKEIMGIRNTWLIFLCATHIK